MPPVYAVRSDCVNLLPPTAATILNHHPEPLASLLELC